MIRPFFAALFLATPTTAQIIPTGSPAADILLTTALAEQRVFLACSSLESHSHGMIVKAWEADTTAAVEILAQNNVPPEAIAAFQTAARPENLLPAPDTPFEEVRELCNADPDWYASYSRLKFTILDRKLPKAFE